MVNSADDIKKNLTESILKKKIDENNQRIT
jgi:hypothetical protein